MPATTFGGVVVGGGTISKWCQLWVVENVCLSIYLCIDLPSSPIQAVVGL